MKTSKGTNSSFFRDDKHQNSKVTITKNPQYKLDIQTASKNKQRRKSRNHHKNSFGPVYANNYDPVKRMAEYGPLYAGEAPPWE